MTTHAHKIKPGFYRTQKGAVIKVVECASSRWPRPPGANRVPYKLRRKGTPLIVYGWLDLDYPLRPCRQPGWWRKLDQARARRLRNGNGNGKKGGGKSQ